MVNSKFTCKEGAWQALGWKWVFGNTRECTFDPSLVEMMAQTFIGTNEYAGRNFLERTEKEER